MLATPAHQKYKNGKLHLNNYLTASHPCHCKTCSGKTSYGVLSNLHPLRDMLQRDLSHEHRGWLINVLVCCQYQLNKLLKIQACHTSAVSVSKKDSLIRSLTMPAARDLLLWLAQSHCNSKRGGLARSPGVWANVWIKRKQAAFSNIYRDILG